MRSPGICKFLFQILFAALLLGSKAGTSDTINLEVDPQSLWPSVEYNFPVEIGPINSGEGDISNPVDINAPIIFRSGEQECTRAALTLTKTSITIDAAKDAALLGISGALDLAGFIVGIPSISKITIITELIVIYFDSSNADDFRYKLARWLISNFVEILAGKASEGDAVIEYFFGESSEDLYDKIGEMIQSSDSIHTATYNHGMCGKIGIRFSLFTEDPHTPRVTKPFSMVFSISGNCEGNDGSRIGLHKFDVVAEYGLEAFKYTSSGSKYKVRAVNPQVYVDAQCHSEEEKPEETEDEDNGPNRPSDVDDQIISFGDWSVIDQNCYKLCKAEYEEWYLAKRTLKNRSDRWVEAQNNLKRISTHITFLGEKVKRLQTEYDARLEALASEEAKSGKNSRQTVEARKRAVAAEQALQMMQAQKKSAEDDYIGEESRIDELIRALDQARKNVSDSAVKLAQKLEQCVKLADHANETSMFAENLLSQLASFNDLSGVWEHCPESGGCSTLNLVQKGLQVTGTYIQPRRLAVTDYGISPGDWALQLQVRSDRTADGLVHVRYPVKYREKCPNQWDHARDIKMTLVGDNLLKGDWGSLTLSENCQVNPNGRREYEIRRIQ